MATIQPQLPPGAVLLEEHKSSSKWEIAFGLIAATVSAVALGILFGPIAAIAGFCCAGIVGACVGVKLHASCVDRQSRILLPGKTELQTPEEVQADLEYKKTSEEIDRLLAERAEREKKEKSSQ